LLLNYFLFCLSVEARRHARGRTPLFARARSPTVVCFLRVSSSSGLPVWMAIIGFSSFSYSYPCYSSTIYRLFTYVHFCFVLICGVVDVLILLLCGEFMCFSYSCSSKILSLMYGSLCLMCTWALCLLIFVRFWVNLLCCSRYL
jgi:hypothetical protein